MNYTEALAWWYGRVDFERRAPERGELKLEQMASLLRCLDNPQDRLRIVHIAGSKGKGSTAAMLAAILSAAGHRTGLLTSPHLCAVEERIQIDGEPIAANVLAALLTEIRERIGEQLQPTFFEIGTAVAWLHFLRRAVDIAVVEVGLGGRFDSTNVCRPLVTLITSISHDHTQILGERLEQIAFEKAGILKTGRPAISGATAPADKVIERVARERDVPLVQIGRDFRFDYQPGRIDHSAARVTVTTRRGAWRPMPLGLWGAHQAANAAVAIATVEQLRESGLAIDDDCVAAGLANVHWPARLEVVGRNPWVVLDCAHNVASVQALIDTLRESFPPCRQALIFGVSNDKDVPGILQRLAPHFDHFVLTQFLSNPRAVSPALLAESLTSIRSVSHEVCPTPESAWQAATQWAPPDALIAITGSVFLAGEMRVRMRADRKLNRTTRI